MAINLQKLALRRLLVSQSNELYSKLQVQYFTGINITVFNRITSYYRANTALPSLDELNAIRKDAVLQEYIETQIGSEEVECVELKNDFLVSQLQDYFIRDETLSFMDDMVDNLDEYEKSEIVDKFQNHMLNLNSAIPEDDELHDVGALDFFPSGDDFKIYPSGLSAEHDNINGGFATQELVLLGGRRGSGKSIISLNMAINRFLDGNTVSFFTIEMRYKEVYDRALSIVAEVPFLDIFRNKLTSDQKIQIARAKFDTFYKESDTVKNLLGDLERTRNFKHFEDSVKIQKPELKDNRLFLIDDESLTINRVDHYANMFKNKYPDYNMAVVDYLNIMKHEDQKDWKTQIVIADALKGLARRHDLTMISPYQIDASGEARFSKGILDSADRSFNFFPPNEGEDRQMENKLAIHTTKIRNGRHMSFDIGMNWECVKIDPNSSKAINEKPHRAAKFGTDNEKTGPRDI